MITDSERAQWVRYALNCAPLTIQRLARRCGRAYPMFRAWRRSEATPSREDTVRLALELEVHAERLQRLAATLRAAAQ